VVDFAGELSIT